MKLMEEYIEQLFSVFLMLVVAAASNPSVQETRRGRAVFVEPRNDIMDSIKKELSKVMSKLQAPKQLLLLDFDTLLSHQRFWGRFA